MGTQKSSIIAKTEALHLRTTIYLNCQQILVSMVSIKVGDIKYYHESGDVFKVEVLNIQERNYGKTLGEEYKLRLLEVIRTNAGNPPTSGLEFAVWKAKNADGYTGWHLLDN